jgi:hypothetical protein
MPRRLLAVALAGALALTGLTACREQPMVAAYVGDAQLTNADVEKIVHEFPADIQDAKAGQIRQSVVNAFVTREVATRIASERKLPIPTKNTDVFASRAKKLGISPTGGFFDLQAGASAAMKAIQSVGQAQAPTEADQRAIFDALVNAGDVPPGIQFSDVQKQIDSPELRAALGLRPVIADAVHAYGVTVNPRYRPLSIYVSDLLAGPLSVPIDENAHPAVVDLR